MIPGLAKGDRFTTTFCFQAFDDFDVERHHYANSFCGEKTKITFDRQGQTCDVVFSDHLCPRMRGLCLAKGRVDEKMKTMGHPPRKHRYFDAFPL